MDLPTAPTHGLSRRKWLRWGLAITATLIVVLAGKATVAYYSFVLPDRKLANVTWRQQATPVEILDTAHRVLAKPGGNHHDAFLYVGELGGPESVPILIRALKWQGHTEPGEVMVCTKGHCLDALEKITGQKAGVNYEDWKKWWDSVGRQLPAATTRPASKPAQGA